MTPEPRPGIPPPLTRLLEEFQAADRAARMELLLDCASRFHEVPPEVASRPFPAENRVTHCESEAYVWARDAPGGTLDFYFAVENPQGLSARAWAVIIGETLSGQPLEQVAAVPGDVVFQVFGRDLSMGRGGGLSGMLALAQRFARQRLGG